MADDTAQHRPPWATDEQWWMALHLWPPEEAARRLEEMRRLSAELARKRWR